MEEKITCPHCNHRVNKSAKYCENCGSRVSEVWSEDYQVGKSDVLDELSNSRRNNQQQSFILIGLLALCAFTFYYFTLGAIADITGNWDVYQTVEPISVVVTFLTAGVALMIALGMDRGKKKVLAIIAASIYCVIHLYWFVEQLIPEEPIVDYLQF
ncbi:MAG: zinc ribbon domain-containing protein [Crocinitomicaceae bacterium]